MLGVSGPQQLDRHRPAKHYIQPPPHLADRAGRDRLIQPVAAREHHTDVRHNGPDPTRLAVIHSPSPAHGPPFRGRPQHRNGHRMNFLSICAIERDNDSSFALAAFSRPGHRSRPGRPDWRASLPPCAPAPRHPMANAAWSGWCREAARPAPAADPAGEGERCHLTRRSVRPAHGVTPARSTPCLRVSEGPDARRLRVSASGRAGWAKPGGRHGPGPF